MHGAMLCGLAYKNGKEVLLLCKPGAGMSCEELPTVGSGSVGSWGVVNMSGDSASSNLKIFVIEGGDSKNHDVMLYESRTQFQARHHIKLAVNMDHTVWDMGNLLASLQAEFAVERISLSSTH